ncbi:protein transport protein YIP1, putative [Plasmodium ovale curtisi]|uniref:Protein transport protein YIP1, putative n=1 Tax=Plasmodium ovale curtisi TaxID=864141 RepID=A0A1A8WUU1_PLAOA|nr:protein transport protein YIP1, putative [Plasmodium ovale curtisi]
MKKEEEEKKQKEEENYVNPSYNCNCTIYSLYVEILLNLKLTSPKYIDKGSNIKLKEVQGRREKGEAEKRKSGKAEKRKTMSYYSQRITNRVNNRNDNDDLNAASGEQSLGNPYLNKKIYENNYKPGNLIPSAPFENSSYQNNPIMTKNVNYINNNSNKGNVVTSPFGNHLNIDGDINKKGDAFFSNHNTSNKHKTCQNENKQDDDEDAEDELPLLEELGINFDLIAKRMKSVFMFYKIDHTLFENSDLSGPLIIVLSLGFILLLAGKASFSYIYLIGIVSSVSIYLLLNMMSQVRNGEKSRKREVGKKVNRRNSEIVKKPDFRSVSHNKYAGVCTAAVGYSIEEGILHFLFLHILVSPNGISLFRSGTLKREGNVFSSHAPPFV